MVFINREFDPYKWSIMRRKGKSLYFIDYGLLPGFIAAIAYAALMVVMDGQSSPYLNAAAFALVATPIYIWLSHRSWEFNEDAFASWVVEEGRRLMSRNPLDHGDSDKR